MTGRARVHARGRRRDTPPSEPAQPEAARGPPPPRVPGTDPPLSFADLVKRGTAVSSLELLPLCQRRCLSREEGGWWLSWNSASPALGCSAAETTAGLPAWQASSPPLAPLSPVCLRRCTQAFPQTWVDGEAPRSLGLRQWLLFGEWPQSGRFYSSVWTDWVGQNFPFCLKRGIPAVSRHFGLLLSPLLFVCWGGVAGSGFHSLWLIPLLALQSRDPSGPMLSPPGLLTPWPPPCCLLYPPLAPPPSSLSAPDISFYVTETNTAPKQNCGAVFTESPRPGLGPSPGSPGQWLCSCLRSLSQLSIPWISLAVLRSYLPSPRSFPPAYSQLSWLPPPRTLSWIPLSPQLTFLLFASHQRSLVSSLNASPYFRLVHSLQSGVSPIPLLKRLWSGFPSILHLVSPPGQSSAALACRLYLEPPSPLLSLVISSSGGPVTTPPRLSADFTGHCYKLPLAGFSSCAVEMPRASSLGLFSSVHALTPLVILSASWL